MFKKFIALAAITIFIFGCSGSDAVAADDNLTASSSSQAKPSSSSSSSSSWSLEEAIGSMTDSRDGRTYKIVSIGTQTWMAENLNYKTSGSYCYGDDAGNCSKYGRLYEWSAAMGACPTGWHLPSDEEWNILWDAVGGIDTAGLKLKSTSGWYDNGNGTDSFGFAVLPAGYRYNDGSLNYEGDYAYFWSSTEYGSNSAYYWFFDYHGDDVYRFGSTKDRGFSVRCLRDSDEGSGASSSSSQAQPSSSSSSSIKDPELVEGTMTDSRDGQTYKTVKIGAQTWMAENLNYDPGDVSGMGSYAWQGCYDNSAANCAIYGRLYTWEVAMDKAGCGYRTYCNNSNEGTQGVCPAGWHLPSDAEWRTLFKNVGGTGTAGSVLKSSSGWSSGNGTNSFGFAVLPAGYRGYAGDFYVEGDDAYFWSSTEDDSNDAYGWGFYYYDDRVAYAWGNKDYAYSVRCLRD